MFFFNDTIQRLQCDSVISMLALYHNLLLRADLLAVFVVVPSSSVQYTVLKNMINALFQTAPSLHACYEVLRLMPDPTSMMLHSMITTSTQ